jgi:hypothetical protein
MLPVVETYISEQAARIDQADSIMISKEDLTSPIILSTSDYASDDELAEDEIPFSDRESLHPETASGYRVNLSNFEAASCVDESGEDDESY